MKLIDPADENRMTWFAVRTQPGSQQPQREYAVETTKSIKGYRIVPSLNPRVSAVERALSDRGYTHYMPAEFQVVRNRKKTGEYCIRRFPLLPGYIFVTNCSGVKDVPGVADIIGTEESPLAMKIMEVLALRTIEARSELAAERELAKNASGETAEMRKSAAKSLAAAKRKLGEGKTIKMQWGKYVGREATLLGWEDEKTVRAILHDLDSAQVAIPYEHVKLVA